MPDPTPYVPGYSFTDYQTVNPDRPLPATSLDSELNDIAECTEILVDALADIRRSDGALANQSVGPDQISPALSIGFTNRGAWSAGVAYSAGDGVAYVDTLYSALVAHTSTNPTRPDLSPATWMKLFDLASVVVADGSIITAKLADGAVTTIKIGASQVTTAKIADANVTTAKIADANVTTAKIADANVTPVKTAGLVVSTKVTAFTAGGTFTPDPKMIFCIVEGWGAGGGGGGAQTTGASQASVGNCGNGGAYARVKLTAAQVGASQAVGIGAGGAGNSGANGSAGGDTTFGSLLSAKGGEGGNRATAGTGESAPTVDAATQSATGDIRGWTQVASPSQLNPGTVTIRGTSGQGALGGGKSANLNNAGVAANANTGAGGGGVLNGNSQSVRAGGAGGSGYLIVTEFLGA